MGAVFRGGAQLSYGGKFPGDSFQEGQFSGGRGSFTGWGCSYPDTILIYEPQYLQACAHNKDSGQPAHLRSLIRIFSGYIWIAKDAKLLHADNEDSDQTARMCRLI